MANERGRLTDLNGSTIILLHDTTSKTKILAEDNDVQGGLIKTKTPTQRSKHAACQAIYGRGRVIVIEGVKIGTQSAIEDFIRTIDNWINFMGLNKQRRYYPMFCKTYVSTSNNWGADGLKGDGEGNSLAATNLQDGYYIVAADDFHYKTEVRTVGHVLQYSLTMFECEQITE